MRRGFLLLALLFVSAAVLAETSVRPGAHAAPRAAGGGIFRVVTDNFDAVDPALGYTSTSWALLDAACARLMNYPDKPLPAGLRLVPEVAARSPRVSADAKTFTFTLRTGFRFSDGTPVRASAFARAINRVIAISPRDSGFQYVSDIVGADAVRSGKATSASGVVAKGNRLVVRLKASAPDFPARTTMTFFCAVPPGLPLDPEGVGPFPGSGPYYVSDYVRGQRVVLSRNPFYGGSRPHRVDGFVADLQAPTPEAVLKRVERNQADWGSVGPPVYFDPALRLVAKYGKSRLFIKPGLTMRGFALNMARPLFRNNLALRRAVNFAVDRSALTNAPGTPHGQPSDQYLPAGLPGFRDARIYPLGGPDLQKARALARGHTRSGRAVLWTFDFPPALAAAQTLKRNLRAIGLDVEVRGFPNGAYAGQVASPGARYDIAFSPWVADYIDPYQYVNVLLESRFLGSNNWSRLHLARSDALMRRAALLQGDARYRAYGKLDVQLSRDVAPRIAVSNDSETTFVSKRVGCIVLRPWLDLTAACLR